MTTRNCRNQDLDLLIMTQIVKYNGQNRNSIHFRTEILEKILFGGVGRFCKIQVVKNDRMMAYKTFKDGSKAIQNITKNLIFSLKRLKAISSDP